MESTDEGQVHQSYCLCRVPRCSHCSLLVPVNIRDQNTQELKPSDSAQPTLSPSSEVVSPSSNGECAGMEMVHSSARKDLKNTIIPCLKNIDKAEILRNISHICKSDSSLPRTKNWLSQNPSMDDILGCLCGEVGDDIRPLISLLELLRINENNGAEIQKCIKELESYRESLPLSRCEECSSPPITPTATLYFSVSTFSYSADSQLCLTSGPVEPSSIPPDNSSFQEHMTPENHMQISPFYAEIQPSFDTS